MGYKGPLSAEDRRIGATIRALREKADLTAYDLAKAVGKSEALISAIERGERRARDQICQDIARALRVPTAAIIVADHDVSENQPAA